MLGIKKECTGCMACMNICPVGAIVQEKDEYGFVMPKIDMSKCIDCNKCESVCILTKTQTHFVDELGKVDSQTIYPVAAYSMYNLDEEIVEKSSSGGAFYTLANEVVKQGGVVFGSYYDIEKKSAYLTDTDSINLEKLLTSKYVESYIGDGFNNVKTKLEEARRVLFCGTPCQCAGLKAFLGKEYDNLLTVDFTCGAVTAQEPLADYIGTLEDRYGAKANKLNFRDKKYGWGQYCMAIDFSNGRKYRKTAMSDPYFFCFLRSSMQRLSCHGCRFSNRHVSDIVLADFWKCDHFDVDSNDRRGISLVLCMNEKGRRAIEDVSGLVHMEELKVEEASYNLKYRECPNSKLEEIEQDQMWAKKYGVKELRNRLLSGKMRMHYAMRQYVMDRPELAKKYNKLVGNGQIISVKKKCSQINSIEDIIELMKEENVKVISFDVFDTLITRPVGCPSDLFELLDKYYKELDKSVISFKKLREEAENVLRRKITNKEIEVEDIILDDIYKVLVDTFGMSGKIAEKMKLFETELELRLSIRREAGYRLYEAAKETGKKIIIVSDMYLPSSCMSEMLEKNGYSNWDDMYVSGERGLRKLTGNLYKYVINDLDVDASSVLHIGDNKNSDYELAIKEGIKAAWLPGAGYVYGQYGCSKQVRKICADLTNWEAAERSVGISAMRQLSAIKYFDDPFRTFEKESDYNGDPYFVGYGALGMELLALVNWIIERANRDGVDNVIFMARDGYLPMRAYEILAKYKELPKALYLPVSRLAVFPAMITTPMDLYDLPIDLNYQTPDKLLSQLEFCIKDCSKEEIVLLLNKKGFENLNEHFTKDTYVKFINLIITNLYDEAKHNKAKEHIAEFMLSSNKAQITGNSALFDMGYSGRIPAAIIHATGVKPKVYFFHSDSREHFRYQKCEGMDIQCFLDFNPYMEDSIREYSYLEPAASCIGYDENLEPVYDMGPAKGYVENVRLMQAGALDFIKDYMKYFGEFSNEAAFRYHDAAMPFEAFIRYCSEYDRAIYDKVLIDDELWGGRRDIDLKELMEIRLRKIPEYAKEKNDERSFV